MATLADTLTTPDSDAVVSGTIALTATRQRSAGGGKTLVKITYPIEVASSTYSAADIPAGEYDVIERLESDEGIWGTEKAYKVVVPDDTGTWSLRALREMYEGPPAADPDLFLTTEVGDSRYAPITPGVVITRDAAGRVASVTENGVTSTYSRDATGVISGYTRGSTAMTITRTPTGAIAEIGD
ncbi:hypothetical protein GYA93_15735 [Gordonia desulfuricans]|uniref:Uncharacterized protein n=1 Tax=Gordonia desulfuricans TaxID=89051 RepID=A0A7K3LRY5_9ACTN|nr:hypothetical protein [Gordonia desulfuricans]NDK91023.1 hypothetical protein [Gordonia desulfuricans]